MIIGMWSDPSAVTVFHFVVGSKPGWTIVISGELMVSPAILVSVGSFITPKSESLIWSATSFPLVSVLMLECHRGWWALKSPVIMLLVSMKSWLMLVIDPLGHEDNGGMYTLTNLISELPEVMIIACCSMDSRSYGGAGRLDIEYWSDWWIPPRYLSHIFKL